MNQNQHQDLEIFLLDKQQQNNNQKEINLEEDKNIFNDANFQKQNQIQYQQDNANLFRLPKKINLKLSNIDIQANKQIDQIHSTKLKIQQQQIISSICEYLQNNIQQFEDGELKFFDFQLPETIFLNNVLKNKPILTYKNSENQNRQYRDVNEYGNDQVGVGRGLSSEQRKQILKTGTFDVKSISDSEQNYVWQLHRFIIKGKEQIKKSLFGNFVISLNQLYKLPGHIFNLRKRHRDYYYLYYWRYYDQFYGSHIFKRPSIFYGIFNCLVFVLHIGAMFIGFPFYKKQCDENAIQRTLFENKMRELRENRIKYNLEFFSFLSRTKEKQENYNKIKSGDREFYNVLWVNNKEKEAQNKIQKDEFYLVNLQLEKCQAYHEFWLTFEKDESITAEVKQSFVNFIKARQLIENNIFQAEEEYKSKYQQLIDDLKKDYPILSQLENFYIKNLNKRAEILHQKIEQQQIKATLIDLNIVPMQKSLFENFIESIQRLKNELQTQVQLQSHYVRFQDIRLHRVKFPPWKSVYDETYHHYYLEKDTYVNVPRFVFWRIYIFFPRLYVWMNNVIFYTFSNSFYGPFGFRALFGTTKFQPDKSCNSQTGAIIQSGPEYSTVLYGFNTVLQNIREDREHFESLPNTGFFGKTLSRIFSLIYNYVFKFFFIGIIGCLICYPVLIIAVSMLSLLLCITSIVWVPLLLVWHRVYQILIYDDDHEYGNSILNSYYWFPLFSEVIYQLIFKGVFQIILAALYIVFRPVIAILVLIWGVIQYCFSTLSDYIMMFFVICCAKIPATDTFIAWNISGPNKAIMYDFYNQIDLDDIYLLVRGFLENKELSFYNTQMQALIQLERPHSQEIYEAILKPFKANLGYDEPKILYEQESQLMEKLNKAVDERRKLYPEAPANVRFTETELSIIVQNVQILVSTMVVEKQLDFIWEELNIEQNQFDKLAKKILKLIFGDSFLISLEKNSKRFKLTSEKNSEFDKIINLMGGDKMALDRVMPEKIIEEDEEDYEEKMKRMRKIPSTFIDSSCIDSYQSNINYLNYSNLLQSENSSFRKYEEVFKIDL